MLEITLENFNFRSNRTLRSSTLLILSKTQPQRVQETYFERGDEVSKDSEKNLSNGLLRELAQNRSTRAGTPLEPGEKTGLTEKRSLISELSFRIGMRNIRTGNVILINRIKAIT